MNAISNPSKGLSNFLYSGTLLNFPPKKILGFIILLSVISRIYICFFTSLPHMHRDSLDYFSQADTLLAGGYTDYFPNGYPAIVALFKQMPGDTGNGILVLNILLSALITYFIYHIAKKAFENEAIALIAALLVALFPSQINLARWLTSEIPATFFLTGGYFFYLKKKYWWAGLFFGLSTIVRTEALLIFFLLLAFEMFFQKRFNWRMILMTAVPLILIGYYCQTKTGKFSISGHSKANIMLSITAIGPHIEWNYMEKHPEVTTTGQAVNLYLKHAREEPGQFLKARMANLWELWSFLPTAAEERGMVSRIILGLGNMFMIFFGLYASWKNRKNYKALILIIPFLVITPLHAVLYAGARYTFPVEPFMLVLCSWTVYKLLSLGRAASAGSA